MLTDEQVITGMMYSYHLDGDDKMAVLELITEPISGKRWCRFDNGDQITLDAFKAQAENVEGQEQPQGDNNQPVYENQNAPTPNMNISQDADGNPILGTGGGDNMEEYSDIVTSPQIFKETQVANDPVIKLLEKANSEEKTLSIEIPVKLVDKKLFDVIKESFGEESKETICKFVMNSVSQEHFKDAMMKMIEKHYGEAEE